jgi:four helix bundle protein
MTNIRSFRELKVWKKAMDLAMEIFEITKRFPPEEKYSLTDQIRRSSRSVPANIAEACRKRRYPAAFVSKLNDGEGESAETQTHLEIARRCGYIDPESVLRLDASYEETMAMLVSMVSHSDQWAIRSPSKVDRKKDD